ncbi:magnesium citrate secondary transporter [Hymenobacter sp. BT175]|nr:magnesium citrate secondary transporter [Hymenobacter translucens]
MPREFRQAAFWLPLLTYLLYQGNRHFWQLPLPPLLTAYLSDALALPVILTLALVVQRRWVHRNPGFELPDTWILAAWIYLTIWFEVLLPRFSAAAVADPLDVLAYGLGALYFRQLLNRPR